MGGRDRLDPRRGEAVAGRLLTGMFDNNLKAGSIHNFPFRFKKESRPFQNDERGGGALLGKLGARGEYRQSHCRNSRKKFANALYDMLYNFITKYIQRDLIIDHYPSVCAVVQ